MFARSVLAIFVFATVLAFRDVEECGDRGRDSINFVGSLLRLNKE